MQVGRGGGRGRGDVKPLGDVLVENRQFVGGVFVLHVSRWSPLGGVSVSTSMLSYFSKE